MLKRILSVALFCLHVTPLNSFAASPADIDSIVADSQGPAREAVQTKIRENQKLILEITELEKQIQELNQDIETNRRDTKRNLYIAGGSAIATVLALQYFGRSTGNEVADQFRIIFGAIAGYAGIATTVVSAGAGGVNYLLVQVDQNKLPVLAKRLQELKNQLQTQNNALLR